LRNTVHNISASPKAHAFRIILCILSAFAALLLPAGAPPAGALTAALEPNGGPVTQNISEQAAIPADRTAFVVVVVALDGKPAQVAMSFSSKMAPEELNRRILDLGKQAGWTIQDIKIGAEETLQKEPRVIANFSCKGIVNRERGLLGIEPLMNEFGREGAFRAIFLVPGAGVISGPQVVRTEFMQARLLVRAGAYEYIVEPAESLTLVKQRAKAAAAAKAAGARKRLLLVILFLTLAAIIVVVVWLRYGRMKENSQEIENGN
jgi:hypothetical protein